MRFHRLLLAVTLFAALSTSAPAQTGLDPLQSSSQPKVDPLAPGSHSKNGNGWSPVANSTTSPGVLFLYDLEKKFAADVLKNGGKAFAAWFAEDGVTIANKQAPTVGHAAIAAHAMWDPKSYQLTWTPQGGQMLPAGDAGYTWGHFDGRSIDAEGNAVTTGGRYITLWKRQADGTWKVALDVSNEEPENCECKLPEPGDAPQPKR